MSNLSSQHVFHCYLDRAINQLTTDSGFIIWIILAHYVSQKTSERYIVFHVVSVSLGNTHMLYTIRLSFERRLIIYACLSVSLSVYRFSVRNYTFNKNILWDTLHKWKRPSTANYWCFYYSKKWNVERSYGINSKCWKSASSPWISILIYSFMRDKTDLNKG